MRKDGLRKYQEAVLKKLSGKIDDFYLVGGTALSLFYFQHRTSMDLDFFMPHFSERRIKEIVGYLRSALKKKIELVGQNLQRKYVRILVYNIHINSKDILKVDFVEDVLGLVKPAKVVEGIRILSLEDIYLRKLYAVSGAISSIDEVGRKKILGGRIDAKDFYDLYFLSHTFINISKFITKYGNRIIIEGLIRWFRTYDRMDMMENILALGISKDIDYKKIEKHFKKEINKIIENQIGEI